MKKFITVKNLALISTKYLKSPSMAPITSSRMMILFALSLICNKLIGLAEAGMKGKGGRQGHIIIQNEIKDQNQRIVPIYMPIPIPVPMPMGPGGDSTQHHQHHHQQRQSHGGTNDDDQGEVKKIYLLQPMPKIQPQLKGGQQQHIMGPVQTHIHLPVPMAQPLPIHHQRRPQNFNAGHQQQAHKQSQYGEGDESIRQQPNKGATQMSLPGHSDMKILPIVVIPPIAPMPPIRLHSSPGHHQQQPYESRLHHSTNNDARRRHHGDNYGGSGGGVAFWEAYGSGRGRRHQHEQRSRKQQRFQDENMNDDFGDYGPPRPRAAASQHQMRAARAPLKRRRHNQYGRHDGNGRRLSGGGGRESIRDIINDQQQQQVTFDDDLDDYNGGEQSAMAGCCGGTSSLPEMGHKQPAQRLARPLDQPQLAQMDNLGNDLLEQQQPESYARAGARASRLTAQDKAELADYVHNQPHQLGAELANKDPTYYEHELLQADRINQRELTGRRLYSSEREAINDDDEWWFDSVKSVSHVASPTSSPSSTPQASANETTNSTSHVNTTIVSVLPKASQDRAKGLQF